LNTRDADLGFEGLGDEEEGIYDDDNEDDDDDGDALSSSPSIPDDVSPFLKPYLPRSRDFRT